MDQEVIVVTRHPALVDLLREWHLIDQGTPWIEHATREDIEGKVVVGVLPLSLARYADSVVEVPLALTSEMRGRELSLNDLLRVAGRPIRYRVTGRELPFPID